MTHAQAIQAIVARELATVVRTRSYWVLLLGTAVAIFGLALAGGGPEAGYLPTAVDLRLPMELLVPALAVALGYPTIVADARRGELDVFDTYPLPSWGYVFGVYLGRALAMAAFLVIPLTILAGYVATTAETDAALIATHQGADSIALFARFAVLTLLFGFAILAVVLAASALAWSRRSAVVLAVLVFGGVVLGLDLFVLRGFGGELVGTDSLTGALALSPTSAYRGLLFESVLSSAIETDQQYAAPIASVVGLLCWTILSLGVTTVAVTRR
ncbi:ABC transporter permease [Halovenus rubra]|uniref:ABC transporter permease n=2 Tax=Halovenus rubra TaxID=869890 RepID=A0ABD5XB40_9EURY|nr:hypothetical protein [Halovenus rubra]